jgi:hypothetical protein
VPAARPFAAFGRDRFVGASDREPFFVVWAISHPLAQSLGARFSVPRCRYFDFFRASSTAAAISPTCCPTAPTFLPVEVRVSRLSFEASKPLPGSGDLEIAFDSGPFAPPPHRLAASPPATPASAAPPAISGVLALVAAVAMLPPADFAPAMTASLAEASSLVGADVDFDGRERDRDLAAAFGFERVLPPEETFAFVEPLAFVERFLVAEPARAEPAFRPDFADPVFREAEVFGLPAPPDPFAEPREALLLALLPFELELFFVELERLVLL